MELLKGFPSMIEAEVRWGDMDAYQHVNNTIYFRYFEMARIAYFAAFDFGGLPQGVAPLLHSTNCRFRYPMTYPDTAVIGSKVVQLGRDRFKIYHRIVSQKQQILAAEGYAIIVAFDYDHNRVGQFAEDVYQEILQRDQPEVRDRIRLEIN